MTTTDARKRNAGRTATATYTLCTEGNVDYAHVIACRAIHILPTEPRDQERDMTTDYRKAAQSLLDGELTDHGDLDTLASAGVHALLAIHDAITAEPDPDAVAFEETVVDLLGEIRDALVGEEPCTPDEWRAYSAYAAEMASPEPVDVTEEPPVGSQVTDKDGVVLQHFSDGWSAWDGGRWASDPRCSWDQVTRTAPPLRPTTDADRERVGLTESSVNSSEGSVNEGECSVDTAPDVDPDEARVCFTDECGEPCQSLQEQKREEITTLRREVWKLSRRLGDERGRTKELEADVERLTRERGEAEKEIRRLHYNPVAQEMKRQRDKAVRRYRALREDVEQERRGSGCRHIGIEGILTRDDERAKQ